MEIQDGEIVSILGPSGCGKTTLLNLILGLTDADEGQILFDGQEMTRLPMEKRGFNIVFQDYALFPNLNVYQNITYGLKNRPGISTKQEVEELIDLLGLREHLAKKIEQLSGGQKQRAALARTMVMKPKILLLDEPLSALDGVIKESIKEKNPPDRQRLPSDDDYCYPRSGGSADAVRQSADCQSGRHFPVWNAGGDCVPAG